MLTTALYLKYATKALLSFIQDCADVVEQWSCNYDMRTNTSKTKEMAICLRKRQNIYKLSVIYLYKWKRY